MVVERELSFTVQNSVPGHNYLVIINNDRPSEIRTVVNNQAFFNSGNHTIDYSLYNNDSNLPLKILVKECVGRGRGGAQCEAWISALSPDTPSFHLSINLDHAQPGQLRIKIDPPGLNN